MKFLIIISLVLVTTTVNASTLILEEIQKSIIEDYKLEGKVKEITPDEKAENKKVEDNTTPTLKISKGEQAIKDQLQKNKEQLKALREAEKNNETNAESNDTDWAKLKQQEINNWQQQKSDEIATWQKEKQEIINNWMIEKSKFNLRIPEYKENLISSKVFESETKEIVNSKKNFADKKNTTKVSMPVFPDYFVIDKALDVEIKDQGKRPTCASFSGVRAIEILLAQQGKSIKLSEQYFFWASLPNCQSRACSKVGSWVYDAYLNSRNSKNADIPLEKDCIYSKSPMNDNVTQIPLDDGCKKGFAKINKFSSVKTTAEIITAIKAGHPVIGGFKLSENFYKNNGYVFQKQSTDNSSHLDSHAAGHAILLVGIMKLPKELNADEGSFCLVSANSWGSGWGKGGHACLSEKWINQHRFDVDFISLDAVESI